MIALYAFNVPGHGYQQWMLIGYIDQSERAEVATALAGWYKSYTSFYDPAMAGGLNGWAVYGPQGHIPL